MENFVKYLTPGKEDKNWGLYLNVAGTVVTKPNTEYPQKDHPASYYFTWEKGRILQEYQINYISEGSGILETTSGKYPLKSGTLFIIRPGIKHRYRPLKKTGWHENYIGFNGKFADHLLSGEWFNPSAPVIYCGYKEELIDTYMKIFDLVREEKPGYQQIVSGLVIKLLGYIVSAEKQKEFKGKDVSKFIEEVRFRMREEINQTLDLKKMAHDHLIGYSYFRKMFKKYTGVAPHQYNLELKIMRAKELLLSTNKSIKEISFDLGFQSIYYFSRLFKNKTGISPSEFRR